MAIKVGNLYAQSYPSYEDTPKAVIAAVAYSLAMRLCGDDAMQASAMLHQEWDALHQNGIVPQPPKP